MTFKKDNNKKHLCGIVPISGRESKLCLPWPDSCHPIKENHLAIERSVLECAYAGCDSIWVVCNDDVAPLIKKQVGDCILDPYCFERQKYYKFFQDNKKFIPIFYTPIHPKDRDRRDSLVWSVLHGALSCFYITRNISSWLEPTKYYVSFPYGIYNPEVLKDNRSLLAGDKSVYISYKGETVRQNRYLGFSFSPQDWKQIRYDLKNNCSGGSRSLPFEQRWSSKKFTLDKIFNNDKIIIDSKKEIDWYFNLDSWDNLVDFYKSSYYNEYKVPNTKLMSEKRLNRITNE